MSQKAKKVKEEQSEEVEEIQLKSDDEEEEDEDFELDDDEPGLGDILNHFLTDESGTNIADILSGLKKSIDTHNKLLLKLVNTINN